MDLRALLITLYVNLNVCLAYLMPLEIQSVDTAKDQFLKKLSSTSPSDVVYIFYETELEEWSPNIYRAFAPVYSINLSRKGCLFREDNIMKDNDTVLYNESLYIVSLYNFSLLKQTVSDIRQLVFWKARHRIIFVTRNDTGTTENIADSFRYCFRYWIINIGIVFFNNLDVAYTYNPFEDSYFIQRNISEVFFDKTLNLYGFKLNVTLFPDKSTSVEIDGVYEGIDIWMSRVILDAINATYDYVIPSEGAVFGGYNETSADGALGDIVSERSQVGFNSRFFREKLYKVVSLYFCFRRNEEPYISYRTFFCFVSGRANIPSPQKRLGGVGTHRKNCHLEEHLCDDFTVNVDTHPWSVHRLVPLLPYI